MAPLAKSRVKVADVRMASGPRAYYAAVRTAKIHFERALYANEVLAQQEFKLKVG